MLPPKKLKILGRDVTVRRRPAKAMPDATGEWYADECLIQYRAGQIPHDEADSVLHEVMHAVLHMQGRVFGGEVEETYVRALATGVLNVLRDNPKLAAWLTRPLP